MSRSMALFIWIMQEKKNLLLASKDKGDLIVPHITPNVYSALNTIEVESK